MTNNYEEYETYGVVKEINVIGFNLFKYLLVTGPIDNWGNTMTERQLSESQFESDLLGIVDNNTELGIDNLISSFVFKVAEERPHTIRYTGIPKPDIYDVELVAIAKIYNNGTCFMFSNDFEYLSFINNKFC